MKLHNFNAEIKIIIVIRDPIDRAFSAYRFEKNKGIECSKDFIEAIQKDSQNDKFGYINRSNYHYHIDRCKKIIPEKNIFILKFDDLRLDSSRALDRVCEFLNVNKDNIANSNQIYNKSIIPKSMFLQRFLWNKNGFPGALRKLFSFLPSNVKKIIKTNIIHKLRNANIANSKDNETLTPELRKLVRPYFHTIDIRSL